MKKKITILMLLSIVMMTSCINPYVSGVYNLELKEVERPKNAEERYGDYKVVNLNKEGVNKYSYEDKLIRIVWTPESKQFYFRLENKSDHSIKIIWDEAVYVDVVGRSGRVMHTGVKYSEMNNAQPSTVVARNTSITDIIIPTKNIRYESGQHGGWITDPLFVNIAKDKEKLDYVSKLFIGRTVKIVLPIQIQETVNEYIFSFNIESFKSK